MVNPIQRSHCLFEYIYFLRPLSIADGVYVESFRKNCGKTLAKKEIIRFNPKNTVVVGAPYTGIPSAKKYAEILGLPYKQLLTKTKKRRTFILPENRDKACDTIYQYSEPDILNKKIILIDDSIVRGNTLKSIAKQLRRLGAKEIHIRVASPPVISECFFGIDIPTKEELIGCRLNCDIDAMKDEMGLDSLVYLTVEETIMLMGRDQNFCSGCFTGKYPDSLLDW
jgi:amidophosphoribosyltransferase